MCLGKQPQEREDKKLALDELTKRLEPTWVLDWKNLEEKAMTQRGDALMVYDVTNVKSQYLENISIVVILPG